MGRWRGTDPTGWTWSGKEAQVLMPSARQREVLAMMAPRATNREITNTLLIAEATVEFHLRTVLRKLNLRHRSQAAIYAIREALFRTTGSGTSPELAIPSSFSRHLSQGEGKQPFPLLA